MLIHKDIEKHSEEFAYLASQILDVKKLDPTADTCTLENEIDFMVNKLYSLTYDEVLTIDPQTRITK